MLAQHNTSCFSLLARHQSGDWGNVPAEDALSNQEAIERGYRIMSVYSLETGKVWIITEADRSVTTVLLPEEY
ncbi:MAG TPA: type I restriction endonuclease subunit M [Agitococcus sp.]|nr:type I restriction endonuclease subunit M [Agitococcus sp.]